MPPNGDLDAPRVEHRAGSDKQSIGLVARQALEGDIDLTSGSGLHNDDPLPAGSRRNVTRYRLVS